MSELCHDGPPITAVVFDFGGVLSSPLAPAFAAVQEAAGISGEELGRAMALVAERSGSHPLYELECGRLSEPEFMGLLEDALREVTGRDDCQMHAFTERYFRALGTNDEMVGLVRSVRDDGYRTALLTNNVREWEPRWRAMLPVDELFEDVVDSAFVGMRKPDPAIYELSASRLGVPAEQCLFVDDFAINCDAARAVGMTPVWFRETDAAIAEIRDVLARRGAPPGA